MCVVLVIYNITGCDSAHRVLLTSRCAAAYLHEMNWTLNAPFHIESEL